MKRLYQLDFASGICLLIVIYGHIIIMSGNVSTRLYLLVDAFCFYLAFFFFKSGLFARSNSQKLYIENMKKDAKRLLVPFCFFSFWGFIVHVFIQLGTDEFSSIVYATARGCYYDMIRDGSIYGNKALWFLPVLFLVKQVYSFGSSILKDKAGACLFLVGIVMLVLFHGKHLPLYFANTALGLMLFSFGNILGTDMIHSKKICLISFAIYIFLQLSCFSHVDIMYDMVRRGNYIVGLFAAFAGCIFISSIGVIVKKNVLTNIVAKIGKNSMNIYLLHWPVVIASIAVCKRFCMNNFHIVFIVCFICVLLLPLFNKLFKIRTLSWMTGN